MPMPTEQLHQAASEAPGWSVVRTVEPRGAAALTGAGGRKMAASALKSVAGGGVYVVGGWLLLSRLFSVGIGPIDQSALDASPAPALSAPRLDRGATTLKVSTVSVAGGPTYECLVPAHLVSADAIVLTQDEYDGIWRQLDCS